jgi:hypothetical protein
VNKNPPIPFVSNVEEMKMVDGNDTGKTELIKLDFFIDPDNPE